MSSPQYFDVLQFLHECRDVISEAQSPGLPRLTEGKELGRLIKTLLDLNLIDHNSSGSMRLSEEFLSTLDKIAPGRKFRDFSRVEIERVALALTA